MALIASYKEGAETAGKVKKYAEMGSFLIGKKGLDQILQTDGKDKGIKTLLSTLDNYGTPVAMHILASLVKAADPLGAHKDKTPLTLAAETLLSSIEEYKTSPNKQIDNLVATLLKKMGLDKAALEKVVPVGVEWTSIRIRSYVLDMAIEIEEDLLPKIMAPVNPALLKTIQDMVQDSVPSDLKDLAAAGLLKELAAKAVCHFLAPLALLEKPGEPEAVKNALNQLAKIAKEKLKDFDKLRAMPKGAEKKLQKRTQLRPLVQEILQKAGWGPAGDPSKLLQGLFREHLEDTLLPNLLYKALDKWYTGANPPLDEKVSDAETAKEVIKPLGERIDLLLNLPNLSYPALMHMLGNLVSEGKAVGGKKQPFATVALDKLLSPLFAFANANRDALKNAFPDRKAFRNKLMPLVRDLQKSCGLDSTGLEKILLVGSGAAALKIEEKALDFFVEFYEGVIAAPNPAPPVEGYVEGRHLIQCLVEEKIVPTIRDALCKPENGKKIQEKIAAKLQAKLPLDADWIAKPFQEWVNSSPNKIEIEKFVAPYFTDALTDFFARLADKYTGTKKDMATDAISHLVSIFVSEIRDPNLVDKLRAIMALKEGQEKEAKKLELFGPCAARLLKEGGWDNLENIRVPKMLQEFVKELVEKTVLPDQMFQIACNIALPKTFDDADKAWLEKRGVKQLDIICGGLADKLTPKIFKLIGKQQDTLAAAINHNLAKERLLVPEEAWLGSKIDAIVAENSPLKPVWKYAEKFVSEALKYGLSRLALKRPNAPDVATSIGLYLRDLLQDAWLDPRRADHIRKYRDLTAPLKKVEAEIKALRQQAIQERKTGGVKAETVAALKKLKAERAAKKTETLKAEHEKLLKSFESLVTQLLSDMGFPTAKDLPVPYFWDELIWKELTTEILPDLCLSAAENMIDAFDELMPQAKELADLENIFKERHEKMLPPGEKLPNGAKAPYVEGINKLADYIVREVESQAALHGADMALKALDNLIIPEFYGGENAKKAAVEILEQNKNKIALWAGAETPQLVAFVKARMAESLKQMISLPLLKGSLNFITHLEKMEQKDPKHLFDFVLKVVPLITDHFKLALDIAKKAGKTHIHEVDPLQMLQAFERRGKLHPAMPGYSEMRDYENAVKHLKQLQEQKPAAKAHEIDEAKKSVNDNQKLLDAKLQKNFYNDFAKALMQMAGLKGPQDLPGGEAFWPLLGLAPNYGWESANKVVPWLLMEGMRTAFAPEKLNSWMANMLKSLNANLAKRRPPAGQQLEPLKRIKDPKIKKMQNACNEMFDQLKRILPKSMITEFTEFPLLDAIPGKVFAEALDDALKQYPLSRIVEEGLVEAVKALPEKLPKNFDDLLVDKNHKAHENRKNIDTILKEGEQILPLLIKKMEQNLFAWWDRVQTSFDSWIRKKLGLGGIKAKEFFDKIFHFFFISIPGLFYKTARWILFTALKLFSWYTGGRNLEKGRASIVDAKINANLLYKVGDAFMKMYAAP